MSYARVVRVAEGKQINPGLLFWESPPPRRKRAPKITNYDLTYNEDNVTSQDQTGDILALVKEKVRLLIENPRQSMAHKMDHLLRVERNAGLIRKSYPEADVEILKLAIFLHDVDQPFDDKKNHVSRSAEAAERILTEFSFPGGPAPLSGASHKGTFYRDARC
jgi:hypothetical protein